ncbi:hypothetical protein [Leucobacter manosquensis]|uniref:Helix-turn-helix domain-containing protein n=1 Tax=Leucobacter manosquensis TaxID=2810611 RepID=A0ABS5M8C1_9MICO|nr:hypothetical protein [Leucobacter manosquensis]MBS3183460.1 hypothetical protein [Leucobacter manosquensis]
MQRVSEFAKAKGISRGRAYRLANSGALPAFRLSDGSIILEDAAVEWRPRNARPLSYRMAWLLLGILNGENLAGIRDAERARLKRHIQELRDAESPARVLATKVSARAGLQVFFAHPEDAREMRSDDRILLSGVGAPGSGMMAGDVVEGYVAPSAIKDLKSDYLLHEQVDGNVRLRIAEVLTPGRAAIAADLADWGRAREMREANRILDGLL